MEKAVKMKICVETIERNVCTGCGACENICPVKAVFMNTDREGFWYPDIDRQKCIECGRCADVCPVHQETIAIVSDRYKNIPLIYAAWSLNEEIRYHSTSGGIFSELALAILASGGYISGAVYDKKQRVKHIVTNEKGELERIRQSKYVQSDMENIYKEIGRLLKERITVLFCGSPCQCAGVFQYCKEKHISLDKLFLIDFICRGSNSPKVYRKFLNELEEKYQSEIKKVWFKNKTYGWNRFSTRIDFDNGEQYLQDRYHDAYIRGYIEENLYIRPSCVCCKFKGLHRMADITLADFWGVHLDGHMQDSDGGTSMVMLHTEKGQKLWKAVQDNVYQVKKEIDEVIAGNICFENSVEHGANRDKFMKDLDAIPIIENIERFLKR